MTDPARLEQRGDGYRRWRSWEPTEGRERYVYVHQLLAIAEGADPSRVFSGGEWAVHHRNGLKWDNRPANLELREGDRHIAEHGAETARRRAATDGGRA